MTAQVVGDLEISPQQIMLRRSDKAGETSSQYLRIAAGRVKEFTIKSVVTPVDSVTAEITPRGKNDYLVRLSNMPLDGTLEGKELVIQTDIPNHPEIKLPFVVSKMPAVPAGANRPVRVGPTGQVPTGIRRPAEQPVPPAKPPAPPVPPAAPAN
ncbi:MAG: hypothetical protein HYV26_07430 [Candidatus Hydrogenedentes bacterium]|nr:hypothetical protein [Candidatus Hydrogenedentota bacterium]